jgi:hypothetical protein
MQSTNEVTSRKAFVVMEMLRTEDINLKSFIDNIGTGPAKLGKRSIDEISAPESDRSSAALSLRSNESITADMNKRLEEYRAIAGPDPKRWSAPLGGGGTPELDKALGVAGSDTSLTLMDVSFEDGVMVVRKSGTEDSRLPIKSVSGPADYAADRATNVKKGQADVREQLT